MSIELFIYGSALLIAFLSIFGFFCYALGQFRAYYLWDREDDLIDLENEKKFFEKIKDNSLDCKFDFSDVAYAHARNIRTPLSLCWEILDELPDLTGKDILVLFNPELYWSICARYEHSNITLITGSRKLDALYQSGKRLINLVNVIRANPYDVDSIKANWGLPVKYFDCIIGNPPYQSNTREHLCG